MEEERKAWVVTVDMGYGHQRAAYPLRRFAFERVITANSAKFVLPAERRQWARFRFYYEAFSRLRSLPLVGDFLWRQYDRLQSIEHFYPLRDLSRPNLGSILLDRMIRKNFTRSVVEYVRKKDLPFVTTFFAPALAAARGGLPEVYCIITDSDINRVWAPRKPGSLKIRYLAPTERAARRMVQYGVPEEDVFFTGFPLPEENLGVDLEILKEDLSRRLQVLDPRGVFASRHSLSVRSQLGAPPAPSSPQPLNITYTVGGAGAQREIGASLLASLKEPIREGRVRVNLIAGTHLKISWAYSSLIGALGLSAEMGKGVRILCAIDKVTYFTQFNELLRTTDVLWAKPSELSFYAALGLPIVLAPAIGAHEKYNEKWLIRLGAGIPQEDPRYAHQWLLDWLDRGELAEAAWEGYMKAPKFGTRNVETVVFTSDKAEARKNLRYE